MDNEMERPGGALHFSVSRIEAKRRASLGLFHFELDLLQDARFLGQLGRRRPGTCSTLNMNARMSAFCWPLSEPGRVLRHRDADALEQIADGQAVPARP